MYPDSSERASLLDALSDLDAVGALVLPYSMFKRLSVAGELDPFMGPTAVLTFEDDSTLVGTLELDPHRFDAVALRVQLSASQRESILVNLLSNNQGWRSIAVTYDSVDQWRTMLAAVKRPGSPDE